MPPPTRGRPPPLPPLRLFFGDLVALRRPPGRPIMPPICFIIFCASANRLSS